MHQNVYRAKVPADYYPDLESWASFPAYVSKVSNALAAIEGQRGIMLHAIAPAFPPQLTRGIVCPSTKISGYERDRGLIAVTNDTVSSVIESHHVLSTMGPDWGREEPKQMYFQLADGDAEVPTNHLAQKKKIYHLAKERVAVNVYSHMSRKNAKNILPSPKNDKVFSFTVTASWHKVMNNSK